VSSSPIIRVEHLYKHFRNITAVSDLNLEVHKGDVFGFLGPNGAGKSTTIRMLLSLITPSNGHVFIFGKNLADHRSEILRRIGCIIEKPDLYLYLSGEKNLELFARLSGFTPTTKQIYETLEWVGLKGREKDRVKTYSHGMRQRLGIAQTIVHDPELIILDEPTTGLDPQGIIDVRNLIRHLQHDLEKTIFLSSHILSEIELIATRMAIINKGKTIVQGSVAELLSSQELVVTFEVDDAAKADQHVRNSQWKSRFNQVAGNKLNFSLAKDDIPLIVKSLNEAGIKIFSISSKRTLEDYFLKLTHDHTDGNIDHLK